MTTDTHTECTYTQREDYIEHKPNSCRANKIRRRKVMRHAGTSINRLETH